MFTKPEEKTNHLAGTDNPPHLGKFGKINHSSQNQITEVNSLDSLQPHSQSGISHLGATERASCQEILRTNRTKQEWGKDNVAYIAATAMPRANQQLLPCQGQRGMA
jgi:hypothetical protein